MGLVQRCDTTLVDAVGGSRGRPCLLRGVMLVLYDQWPKKVE